MKYIVIEPRGYAKLDDNTREILEFDKSKIVGVESFVQQQVGKEAVERRVGDYIFWIANPNSLVEIENEKIVVPETPNLMCNMLINEVEFAFGGVVITSNFRVNKDDKYAGLNEQDVANIMNLFTQTDTVLIEDNETFELIAVDRIFDALLSFSETNDAIMEEPLIEDIGEEIFDYDTFVETYEDSDPDIFDELEFGETILEVPDGVPDPIEEPKEEEQESL